tara:strand:+ start:152 stop:1168 length:1017 start_codon:yes stop_codon:yes gene_type:complete
MKSKQILKDIRPQNISALLESHYFNIMSAFYETQSSYLTGIYKKYGGIESANIAMCFARNLHLEIIRQREKNLNYNVSLENFWRNFQNVDKPLEKVSKIVEITGIPKETARRKIKNLLRQGFIKDDAKTKGYYLDLFPKHKDSYTITISEEIKILSRFTFGFSKYLSLNLNSKLIEDEIKSQFSFYWYHFLSCQIQWLKIWQTKLKDNDLLLIILQTIIPTLQYAEKHDFRVSVANKYKIIGKIKDEKNYFKAAISAATVAEVTGIPRSTCTRKLNKLLSLGFLLRETKTKRYFVNQNILDRTKNVLTESNVTSTIDIFSKYLSIILNSMIHNKNSTA